MSHTVRYLDDRNATTLGYDEPFYRRGVWVLETAGGEWIADLGADGDFREPVIDEVLRTAADRHDTGTDWTELPGNYGIAYTTHETKTVPS